MSSPRSTTSYETGTGRVAVAWAGAEAGPGTGAGAAAAAGIVLAAGRADEEIGALGASLVAVRHLSGPRATVDVGAVLTIVTFRAAAGEPDADPDASAAVALAKIATGAPFIREPAQHIAEPAQPTAVAGPAGRDADPDAPLAYGNDPRPEIGPGAALAGRLLRLRYGPTGPGRAGLPVADLVDIDEAALRRWTAVAAGRRAVRWSTSGRPDAPTWADEAVLERPRPVRTTPSVGAEPGPAGVGWVDGDRPVDRLLAMLVGFRAGARPRADVLAPGLVHRAVIGAAAASALGTVADGDLRPGELDRVAAALRAQLSEPGGVVDELVRIASTLAAGDVPTGTRDDAAAWGEVTTEAVVAAARDARALAVSIEPGPRPSPASPVLVLRWRDGTRYAVDAVGRLGPAEPGPAGPAGPADPESGEVKSQGRDAPEVVVGGRATIPPPRPPMPEARTAARIAGWTAGTGLALAALVIATGAWSSAVGVAAVALTLAAGASARALLLATVPVGPVRYHDQETAPLGWELLWWWLRDRGWVADWADARPRRVEASRSTPAEVGPVTPEVARRALERVGGAVASDALSPSGRAFVRWYTEGHDPRLLGAALSIAFDDPDPARRFAELAGPAADRWERTRRRTLAHWLETIEDRRTADPSTGHL